MGPRAHDEALAAPGLETFEVPKRPYEQAVVPSRQMEGRDLEAVVASRDIEAFPKRVVAGMGEHVEVAGRVFTDRQSAHRRERQVPHPALAHVSALFRRKPDRIVTFSLRIEPSTAHVRGLSQIPAQAVEQVERAPLKHHVVAARIGGRGEDRHETGGTKRRRRQLRRGLIAAAEHPDFTVHEGQSGEPLDGVVSIFRFVVRYGDAVRSIAAARVLNGDDEAFTREPAVERLIARIRFRVRCSLQERGKAAGFAGTVDIGAEHDAVTHRCLDVLIHDDRVGRDRKHDGRQRCQHRNLLQAANGAARAPARRPCARLFRSRSHP